MPTPLRIRARARTILPCVRYNVAAILSNRKGRLTRNFQRLATMAQQAAVRVDTASELQTESLRLTGFLAPPELVVEPRWWDELVGAQPETRTSKPGRGELQEAGPVGDRTLTLSVQPGRIDWFLTPRVEQGALRETPWVGPFPDAAEVFSVLMLRWLATCPTLVRLAFGATVHQPVRDKVAGYQRLAEYLPDLRVDPERSEDLLYQINRPRTSGVVDGLKINRLSRWSVAQFMWFRLAVGTAIQQNVAAATVSCRIDMDISTDAQNSGGLPRERLPRLFEELRDLAIELTRRGDVP